MRAHHWNRVNQEEANDSNFRIGLSIPDIKLNTTDQTMALTARQYFPDKSDTQVINFAS